MGRWRYLKSKKKERSPRPRQGFRARRLLPRAGFQVWLFKCRDRIGIPIYSEAYTTGRVARGDLIVKCPHCGRSGTAELVRPVTVNTQERAA